MILRYSCKSYNITSGERTTDLRLILYEILGQILRYFVSRAPGEVTVVNEILLYCVCFWELKNSICLFSKKSKNTFYNFILCL